MMKRTLSAIAAAALTAGTLALSTPARAAEDDYSVEISYGDLDLGTAEGKARFQRRARNAARDVCGWVLPEPIGFQAQVIACQKEVMAKAQAELEVAGLNKNGQVRLARRAD